MKSLEIGTPMDQQAQVLAPPAGQMPDPSSGLDGVAALDAAAQAPPGTWEALLGMIELSGPAGVVIGLFSVAGLAIRSEEHTSELQSLMRITYAVFCLQ